MQQCLQGFTRVGIQHPHAPGCSTDYHDLSIVTEQDWDRFVLVLVDGAWH